MIHPLTDSKEGCLDLLQGSRDIDGRRRVGRRGPDPPMGVAGIDGCGMVHVEIRGSGGCECGRKVPLDDLGSEVLSWFCRRRHKAKSGGRTLTLPRSEGMDRVGPAIREWHIRTPSLSTYKAVRSRPRSCSIRQYSPSRHAPGARVSSFASGRRFQPGRRTPCLRQAQKGLVTRCQR